MLRIEELVLHNFKSWYGEHLIALNTQGLACIVGANGSGKSNIIDALLFVFGWRAKQLRQDKLVDLIHQSQYKVPFAKVQVNFSNNGQYFSIGRVIQATGSQHYEVNGIKSTLSNVTQILLDNGLDIAHNRFLILQGEVESISMMKAVGDDILSQMTTVETENLLTFQSIIQNLNIEFQPQNIYNKIAELIISDIPDNYKKLLQKIQPSSIQQSSDVGLLEFIEQVVGTQKFLPLLSQQMALMEYYSNQKQEIRISLSAAVQFRDALIDNKNDSLSKIQTVGIQITEDLSKNMYQASQSRLGLSQKQQQIVQLQQQQQELEKSINMIDNELQQQKEIQDQAQYKIQETTNDLVNITTNIKENQIGFHILEEKNHTILKELQEQLTIKSKITVDQKNIQQENLLFPQQKQLIESQIEQNIIILNSKNEQLDQLQQADVKDQNQINNIQQQMHQIEIQIQPISSQRAQQQSIQQSINKQIDQKLMQFVDLSNQTIDQMILLTRDIQYQNTDTLDIRDELFQLKQKQANVDMKKLQSQHKELNTQIANYNLQITTLNLKIKEGNQQKQEFATNNKLLSAVLDAQKQGLLSGIYGRLGSLGIIDKSLNIAAISAFGPQLDYIVVESMEQVQQCLQFIRTNNLGIASFIDLSQVKSRYSQYYKQFDNDQVLRNQNSHLFLSLVNTKENYIPAFWHVMQETIVTESVQDALIINKNNNRQKLRVVTLNGELFEKSGSLTGGGSSLNSRYKGFRQDVSQDLNITEIQKEINSIEIQKNNSDAQISQIQILLNEQDIITQKIILKNQEFMVQQYEVSCQHQKVQQKIDQIMQIGDNILFQQHQAQINPTIIQEIQQLSSVIQQNSQIWQQNLYQQQISSIIELTTYYEKQGFSNYSSLVKYTQKNDPQFLLESEESLIANIILFPNNLSQLFGQIESQKISLVIEQLKQQEKILNAQTLILQEQIDNLGNSKQYKIVRKEIQQLQQNKMDLDKHLQKLEISNMKYDQIMLQFDLEIQETNTKEKMLNEQQQQISQEQLHINQYLQQLQNSQKQLQAKKQQLLQENIQFEQQFSQVINDQKFRKEKLAQHQANKTQLNQQIFQSQDIILSSETHITNNLMLVNFLNEILTPLQEQLNYQVPLLSSHQNIEELFEYDNYIIANYTIGQSKKQTNYSLNQLKSALQQDLAILEEYIQRTDKLNNVQTIFTNISAQSDIIFNNLNELKDQRQQEFLTAFNDINQKLREIYRIFSMGGDAILELVNHFDPFEGIQFSVMPPKKAWRQIQNLSGGEKTLSSLSLIFALHQFRKNFIYVVDEIDAALDFRNVSLVANYLKEQTKECQFVIISLRNNTFEIADRLIGVYKVDNVSQNVSLDINVSDQ
ncbi:SMC4-like protein [Spironucleus salmonicida]|uniref:Structural maintenance of chromosomes protein n=1 Tax=Spironucleus salmonicida TaxID=348837 RepID=V6LU68_9EUKA|nr:SMC4-like protein [Spironucleus salmonicida]|eukprot:EST47241.1 RefF/RecN/SMC N terminal domain-containing protein [Spironucleus salmonicida]